MLFFENSSAYFAANLHRIERKSFIRTIGRNAERTFVATYLQCDCCDLIEIAVAFVCNAYRVNSERFFKCLDNRVFVFGAVI